MTGRIAGLGQAIRDRVFRLPPAALVGLAAVAVALVAASGVMLYRTYDYVQHDNDFCLSCHLMRNPYERFSRSAHRDLGCKACHQPTFVARSTMALTQIIEQPEELKSHAEVPNKRCADCHIKGDPKKWEQVAQTAGHKVHVESKDPRLAGLRCVQCHSSSVHEFAATDKTCGQAGCHEGTRVRLGKMGQLTIHCAACHNFTAPVAANAPADSLAVALRPRQDECLSCHAMRRRFGAVPANDPHGGACGACHNPHEQTTPAQAVRSCQKSGCHERQDTVSPMHRGLSPGALAECTRCHVAHEFRPRSTACLGCHADIYQRTVYRAGSAALVRAGRDSLQFRHAQHRPVECTHCHDNQRTHGGVALLASFATCQQCHHGPQVRTTAQCTRCHARAELEGPIPIQESMKIASAPPATRTLRFDHAWHTKQECSACHAPAPDRSAATLPCAQCHEQHHQPDNNCRACHQPPPKGAHDNQVHRTCAGAQCHTRLPFQGVPRTRALCLSCHVDQVNHNPGKNCAQCHAVPGQRPAGAGR
ncbi:MAG: hypothetical protein FIB01_03765 [Gemmatimonadetes bacterium]|nr:hypothetical protein [Gemmatimonadota bacterium]